MHKHRNRQTREEVTPIPTPSISSIGNSNNAFGNIHAASNSRTTSDNAYNARQDVRRPAADAAAATGNGKAPVASNLTRTSSTDKYIYNYAFGVASGRANQMKSRIDTRESDYDGDRGSDYEVPIIGM